MTGQHRSASGIDQHASHARQQAGAARGVRRSAEHGGGPDGQQGSGRGTRPARTGPRTDEDIGPAEGSAEELVLQEDEVDWGMDGGGVGDLALQNAWEIIRAKGEGRRAGKGPTGRGGEGGEGPHIGAHHGTCVHC